MQINFLRMLQTSEGEVVSRTETQIQGQMVISLENLYPYTVDLLACMTSKLLAILDQIFPNAVSLSLETDT